MPNIAKMPCTTLAAGQMSMDELLNQWGSGGPIHTFKKLASGCYGTLPPQHQIWHVLRACNVTRLTQPIAQTRVSQIAQSSPSTHDPTKWTYIIGRDLWPRRIKLMETGNRKAPPLCEQQRDCFVKRVENKYLNRVLPAPLHS